MPTRPYGRVERVNVPVVLRDYRDRIRSLEAVAPAAIYEIKIFSDRQVVTTGDGKFYWNIPPDLDQWYIVFIRTFVSVASSSGIVRCQIRNERSGLDIMSTRVSIDANERSSSTAATPVVINQTTDRDQVLDDDFLRLDVDDAGTGAKGLGLIVALSPARFTDTT